MISPQRQLNNIKEDAVMRCGGAIGMATLGPIFSAIVFCFVIDAIGIYVFNGSLEWGDSIGWVWGIITAIFKFFTAG